MRSLPCRHCSFAGAWLKGKSGKVPLKIWSFLAIQVHQLMIIMISMKKFWLVGHVMKKELEKDSPGWYVDEARTNKLLQSGSPIKGALLSLHKHQNTVIYMRVGLCFYVVRYSSCLACLWVITKRRLYASSEQLTSKARRNKGVQTYTQGDACRPSSKQNMVSPRYMSICHRHLHLAEHEADWQALRVD
jgi:hypothetical protein